VPAKSQPQHSAHFRGISTISRVYVFIPDYSPIIAVLVKHIDPEFVTQSLKFVKIRQNIVEWACFGCLEYLMNAVMLMHGLKLVLYLNTGHLI